MKETRALGLAGVILAFVGAHSAFACGDVSRGGVTAPWGDGVSLIEARGTGGGGGTTGGGPGIQAAADHVVAQQCPDGGWGWPHDDCGATYNNITAPICLGLLNAYTNATGDPAHLAAAVAGGDFDLTFQYGNGEYRFGSFAPAFLRRLSAVTSDPQYSTHAAVEFFDELTAGTYGPADLNTAGWIAAVQTARSGGQVNLRPWDFHNLPWVAGEIGNPPQQDAFRDAVLDGLDTLVQDINPATDFGDILGLAGAVRGLALNGTTAFPAIDSAHPGIDEMTTLCQLADYLASLQNGDGSWYWFSDPGETPGETDKDTQTTAYAVLALLAAEEAGCGPYASEIALARDWLRTMQVPSGGFLSYPGGTENTEVEGEALDALGATADISLVPDDSCVEGTEVIVRIEMTDATDIVVGGQFFLEYDNAVLDFVSADPGDNPFTQEIFELVDEGAGTIDYAVGVLPPTPGTQDDTTMAVLTFDVLAESCDTADLVTFRAHTPPTRLSDSDGGPILPSLADLSAITVDSTPPVITCPPDISVNADAGLCTAVVNPLTKTFDEDPVLRARSKIT